MNALAALSLVLLVTGAQAQTATEKYEHELSALCGKQAAATFAKEWGGSSFNVTYENHYNFRLNKCFYLVIHNERGNDRLRSRTLLDLNENREIFNYSKLGGDASVVCWMRGEQGNQCKTEEEWWDLIRPFMED